MSSARQPWDRAPTTAAASGGGSPDANATTDSGTPWPAPLSAAARHGLIGEWLSAVEPNTEADPAAILIQTLVAFASMIGHGPHFRAEADRHALNLFGVIVGPTAKGRKGTSWGYVLSLARRVDVEWATARVKSGLSTGEGLIHAVRDPLEAEQAVKERGRVVDYQIVREDAGVADKRLLICETEFAGIDRRDAAVRRPGRRTRGRRVEGAEACAGRVELD